MFFSPLAMLLVMVFFFFVVFLFIVVQINIIVLAFTEIGIPAHYVFMALLATLIGSFINIPVKTIPNDMPFSEKRSVRFYGFSHMVPAWRRKNTLLAVNVGGAVIPVLLSAYLLLKTGLWIKAAVATLFMIWLTSRLARPLKGVGIALPAFIPPLAAAFISIVVAYHHAPIVAYISGTLGTLVGADILNLKKIRDLGAPVASIGGAGTFDGIFLNGILAVLLSALIT